MSKSIFLIFILLIPLFFSCSRSGQRKRILEEEYGKQLNRVEENVGAERTRSRQSGNPNTIQMRLQNGVYYMPIKINGVEMEFIFDTGASIISISEVEVLFLWKQGKLNESDIRGTTRFSDATGAVSEGTLINLKEVKIGNKTLKDVEASVVHNLEAPLLLGQSALSRFGKVTIDYRQHQLILE